MRRRALLVLMLVSMSVLARGATAWACTCDPGVAPHDQATVKQEFKQSYAVFTGRAVAMVPQEDHVTVTFAVRSVFKGDVSTPYALRTPATPAACGIDFVQGKDYDVFVTLKKHIPTTQVCSGTDATGVLSRAGYVKPVTTYPDDGSTTAAANPAAKAGGDNGARAGVIGAAALLLALIVAYYVARARATRRRARRRAGLPR